MHIKNLLQRELGWATLLGVASVLDLSGSLMHKRIKVERHADDATAIASDWLNIGNDMRYVLKSIETEVQPSLF